MATKTKTVKHPTVDGATNETHPWLFTEDGTPKTPETHPRSFKKDGTPRNRPDYAARVIVRRPDAVVLKDLREKRAALVEKHNEVIAKIDAKIQKLESKGVVDPAAAEKAAKALLASGMTPESIAEWEAKIRQAKAFLKGKSADEVAALAEEAKASAEPAVTYDDDESEEG